MNDNVIDIGKKKKEYPDKDKDKLMSIHDFPSEIKKNMWAIIEDFGTPQQNFLDAFLTEIEALKISRNMSHNDYAIVPVNVKYTHVFKLTVITAYEVIGRDP